MFQPIPLHKATMETSLTIFFEHSNALDAQEVTRADTADHEPRDTLTAFDAARSSNQYNEANELTMPCNNDNSLARSGKPRLSRISGAYVDLNRVCDHFRSLAHHEDNAACSCPSLH